MKKLIIAILTAFLLLGCKTVQRVDKSATESTKTANTGVSSNINTNVTETTNNDKTKTIVITEYVYDTIYQANRVKSVTEIREDDKSKSVREDHSQRRDSVSMVATEESHTQNDLAETEKDESGTGWRLFAFGVLVGVALVILVRLAWKYLKSQISFGLWR